MSGALTAARENARGVRDALPAGRLGVPERHLARPAHPRRSTSVGSARATCAGSRERCAIAAGLVDQVMSHDEGWHFLVVGRSLERADMTIRLIAAADLETGSVAAVARAGLLACGGWEPYVRATAGRSGRRSAIEFVLLDRQFPRSVLRCLTTAESLAGRSGGRSADPRSPDPRRDPSSARRIVGRARTGLDYRTGTRLPPDRPHLLATLQRSVSSRTRAHHQVVLPPRSTRAPGQPSARRGRGMTADPAGSADDQRMSSDSDDLAAADRAPHRAAPIPDTVTTSYNEVRMQPSDEPGQSVLSAPAGASTRSRACSTTSTTSAPGSRPSTSTARILHLRSPPPRPWRRSRRTGQGTCRG